jgi:hypothetical protein
MKQETLSAVATDALNSASEEYDTIIDSLNVCMQELADKQIKEIEPFAEELNGAQIEFSQVNDPAEKRKKDAEYQARIAYERAISLATVELNRAISEAHEKYVVETADANRNLEQTRRRHDLKARELNKHFDQELKRWRAQLHQQEFRLLHTMRKLGVKLNGLSSKRPAAFRPDETILAKLREKGLHGP